jgi:hypothetical protein
MDVTYLLGAGASAKSLPIVSNMKDRFKKFNNFIFRSVDTPNKAGVMDIIRYTLKQIEAHASVDTYAKKMYLQNDFTIAAKSELFLLKHYVSLFFIAEQSAFYKNHKSQNGEMPVPFPEIDPRYDPFLATLLQKKEHKVLIPENVNIISWNYDYQLELAYTAFARCTLNEALVRFNEIPSTFPIDPGGRIFKLNGTAAMYFDENETSPSHLLSNGKEEFDLSDFKNLLESFAQLRNVIVNSTDYYRKPFINFAWEDSPFKRDNAEDLRNILMRTKILVIVGYSFPNFNRLVDRELFKYLTNLEKIYYQTEEKYVKSLTIRLEHVWEFSLVQSHNLEILIWQLAQSIQASEFSTVRS